MKIPVTKLRQLRKRQGWTQRDLAEHLEVDPMTVSRWERGLSHPQRAVAQRLQTLLETTKPESAKSAIPTERFKELMELGRAIGIDSALRALREIALLARKPVPVRFVDEPSKRLREVEAALVQQRALMARAKLR